MSPQVPKSATTNDGAVLDDKRDPDPGISIPSQASTKLRLQSIRCPAFALTSKAPPTTGISNVLATTNHPMMEARNEDYQGNPIQTQEARHGVDPYSPPPTEASTIAIELCTAVCGDGDMGSEEVPSISLFQGASNFQITNANINTIGGNATIIRFDDGQFTEIQRNLICDYIANLTVLPEINNNLKKHVLTQSIVSLPRAKAVFDDYQIKKKSGPCFKGTREALLREMADWATSSSESRMYVLSGLAGMGKSTLAYTIASRAADLNRLISCKAASFFFSRDEADRKNAEFLFTTIAYQLCVYNETFAKAIGDVLLTERGSAATTKDPHDQLQALILEPLRSIVQSRSRPILIVVDALDECDEEDTVSVLVAQGGHRIFRLQDIEDKVVDGDIRLYLSHSLSLEVVQKRYPQRKWCASGEEIDSLVGAVGRLFIIASTAVRYIFDKSAANPAAQVQKLLRSFARYLTPGTPFKDLDQFYTVVLRNVVPEDCDNDDTVSRYQSVVGAIVFVEYPLPISTLAQLINIDVVDIREVLDNLQSVILLGIDDVPRIYHKSFPDYLTDQARCKDPRLQIDTRMCHIQITRHCFEIMDKRLKHNILGLGNPARFMSNEDGLKEDGITDEQMQEKIPQQLRYACVYWVNHLEVANIEDKALRNGLEKFVDRHMLYWFEVLSLIGKLDSAHLIRVALKLLKTRSSDLYQLLSDALCFIGKFYELIKRSALHTYYSALPFTPSHTLLYRRYIKDGVDNLCTIEGWQKNWDALVTNLSHGGSVESVEFSLASTLFVSCSQGESKIWDAITGTPISTITGDSCAVANDFSTIASSKDKTITLYNVNGGAKSTMFTTSSEIKYLALSSESSRVAAALADGTVWLWDSRSAELLDSFDGFESREYVCELWLQFSPTGTRLAYSSRNSIKLRDGISGGFISDLRCKSIVKFGFSNDGSRIASLSCKDGFALWNGENGGLIAAVRDADSGCYAISPNGSLIATEDRYKVTLWSDNRDHLAPIKFIGLSRPSLMTFVSDNILAIVISYDMKFYNVETDSFISTLPIRGRTIAFSPDCTRLAVGDGYDIMGLWDIPSINASGPPSERDPTYVTALTLSQDCSRLACGFKGGTVELWETIPTKRRISHQCHRTGYVKAVEFDPDGVHFASISLNRTIELWNGANGGLRGTLEVPDFVEAVALSNSVLVTAGGGHVALWSLDTLSPISTFEDPSHSRKLSIAKNSALIAVSRYKIIYLLDVVNQTITAFNNVGVFYHDGDEIHSTTFLPDNSQLVVQSFNGVFLSVDLVTKRITHGPTFENLIQLPNTPLWHGVPIWYCRGVISYSSGNQVVRHYLSALFPQHKTPVPVLWIPNEIHVEAWTQGSSMIVLHCTDRRIIIVRLHTSNVS